jgi:hypothetical protein
MVAWSCWTSVECSLRLYIPVPHPQKRISWSCRKCMQHTWEIFRTSSVRGVIQNLLVPDGKTIFLLSTCFFVHNRKTDFLCRKQYKTNIQVLLGGDGANTTTQRKTQSQTTAGTAIVTSLPWPTRRQRPLNRAPLQNGTAHWQPMRWVTCMSSGQFQRVKGYSHKSWLQTTTSD